MTDKLPAKTAGPNSDRTREVSFYLLQVDRYDPDDIFVGRQFFAVVEGETDEQFIVSSVSDYRR